MEKKLKNFDALGAKTYIYIYITYNNNEDKN